MKDTDEIKIQYRDAVALFPVLMYVRSKQPCASVTKAIDSFLAAAGTSAEHLNAAAAKLIERLEQTKVVIG